MAKNPTRLSGDIERLWKEIVGEDMSYEQAIGLTPSKPVKSSGPVKKKRMTKKPTGIEHLIV